MQAAILRAKTRIQQKEKSMQEFSKNFDNFQVDFLGSLKKLQENKQQCLKQFREAKQIGKKQAKQQNQSSIDKFSKIKKSKKNGKKKTLVKPIQQSKQYILVVINRLMSKYTATIAKNSLVWTSKIRQTVNQRNIFVTILKYLEGEYNKFEKQFEKQIEIKKQQIDFGNYVEFQNLLPNEFCAMIFRSFPQLKKYIENFNHSLLTYDDIKVLKANQDSIIPMLLGYEQEDPDFQQDTCEIDFSLLQKQDDEETTTSQRRRGKNKKKRNKKKKSKNSNNTNNNKNNKQQYSNKSQITKQRQIQNEFQIEQIIQEQLRLDDQIRFEQICNLIQNLTINQDQRLPCNVTEQWSNKYLKMNKNYKK